MMLPSKKVAFDFSNEKLIGTYLLLPLITFARDKCLPTGMALAIFFAVSALSKAYWLGKRKGAILAENLKTQKHQWVKVVSQFLQMCPNSLAFT